MSAEEPNILTASPPLGYSADLRIDLYVNGKRYPVAQMGRGLLTFDEPLLLDHVEGELVLTVDGAPRRWLVRFPQQSQASLEIMADFRDPVE